MDWLEVKACLPADPEDWALWVEVFRRHGVEGTVQTDDPPTLAGYLSEADPRSQGLAEDLAALGANVALATIPEVDWAEAWKQFFVPGRIGRRLVVRPTWEQAELMPDDLEIVLDPGQAFGTGDHPTTRLCLELLESRGCAGLRVADIGCGSGILSVAAAKLGAASVEAVDVDPPACAAARANAEANGVAVRVEEGEGFDPLGPGSYDLVLSNIISAALIRLAPEAAARVAPGGAWIVSGIIEANWPDVRAAAERAGFRLDEMREEDGWIAARFLR